MVELEESPSLLIWHILAAPLTFLFAFLAHQHDIGSAFMLLLFGACSTVSLIFVYVIDFFTHWYSDIVEESRDWDDADFSSSEDLENGRNWMLIGLAGLFMSSMTCGFLFSVYGIIDTFTVAFWVPNSLLSTLSVAEAGLLGLLTNVFITFACVVPGEEGFKNCLLVINKAFERHIDLSDWPFCFQPCRIVGNVAWAFLHVILGQNNLFFVVSVFLAGCIMDTVSAQSGTIENNYRIHFAFNSILIIVEFILAVWGSGAVTLIWS